MDTKALERFCPWARTRLIDAVDRRCRLFGLDDDGRTAAPASSDVVGDHVLSSAEKTQRAQLFSRIEERGYDAFCEEMAYTWFNRLAAIRYMELNGYLPSRVRMLSCAEDGSFRPDCLRQAAELDLPGLDARHVLELVAAGDDEALFREILVAQMNELADCLPTVFGHVGSADRLTLPDGLLRQGADDVLFHLVADIPEETWKDVEVLGWMYQFYNAELKADFFKSKRKARPEDLAPATQLFTPEWIVRYMVENSLGRLWMLNNPGSRLREQMAYYIEPDAEHEDFLRISGPEDITFCDPACGSGHILSYAFELLFAMYEERGYRASEIPQLILEKNLTGFEIDERAAQIASLVLALRAREHDRRFFGRGVAARVHVFQSVPGEKGDVPAELADTLEHLGEVGSLVTVTPEEAAELRAYAEGLNGSVLTSRAGTQLYQMAPLFDALSARYDVVVTNPPYMGSSSFNPWMSARIKKLYPDVKSDLCTCFIERGYTLAKERGYIGAITSDTCMYLSSFEMMRKRLVDEKHIVSLIDTRGTNAHPDVFDANAGWIIWNGQSDSMSCFFKLSQRIGEKGGALAEAIQNPTCGWFYRADASTFHDIPGTPIAYWASDRLVEAFVSGTPLSNIGRTSKGLITGDNGKFVRLWWEVGDISTCRSANSSEDAFLSNARWFSCSKGGQFRKWSGNSESVIDWQDNGKRVFENALCSSCHAQDYDDELKFREAVSWSSITSGIPSFRYVAGSLSEHAGMSLFPFKTPAQYVLAFCNSSVAASFLMLLSPTLNINAGEIDKLPLLYSSDKAANVQEHATSCMQLSQLDWDSQETSWDFKRNPLV